MRVKAELRSQAISLRKQGFTYKEILQKVPVAKSTLSLWLREVGMSVHVVQRYTEKKRLASLRGGLARKTERLARQARIMAAARQEIDTLSKRELWLIGIALYWAEGAKEKSWRTGEPLGLTNSDPRMVRIYLHWLQRCVGIKLEQLRFSIYIHKSCEGSVKEVISYWSNVTGMRYNNLQKVYFKRHNPSPKRKNLGSDYHGQLRIIVRNSTDLNRHVAGWIEGICSHCPVV